MSVMPAKRRRRRDADWLLSRATRLTNSAVCAQCGRGFEYTCKRDEWGYKRGDRLYCSWGCMRKGQEGKEMRRRG